MERELSVAINAVKRAGRIAQKVANTEIRSVSKSDRSPVTIADYAAQAVIIAAIKESYPDDPIVGEEDSGKLRDNPTLCHKVMDLCKESSVDLPVLQSKQGLFDTIDAGGFEGSAVGRQWALDPIDGTKGFIRKEQYAVCLALIQDGKVQLGVIGCPNLGKDGAIFHAISGKGAFWSPLNSNEFQPAIFRKVENMSEATFCESVESGHSAQDTQAEIAKDLGITRPPLRMDSQAKYCSIARGDADIYLRLPVKATYEEKIWDHAAGCVIVTEAGGKVSDMNGNALDFGKGRTLSANKGVVACHSEFHSKVVTTVSKIMDSRK